MPMGNGCGCSSSCSGIYCEGVLKVAQTTAEEEYTSVFEIQVYNDSYTTSWMICIIGVS